MKKNVVFSLNYLNEALICQSNEDISSLPTLPPPHPLIPLTLMLLNPGSNTVNVSSQACLYLSSFKACMN